ncbi:MAG: hypothetical protein OES32_00695 [Acidobacteriota bacterium]|nr:hypothetical protein [Acidobacteriota bacterium]
MNERAPRGIVIAALLTGASAGSLACAAVASDAPRPAAAAVVRSQPAVEPAVEPAAPAGAATLPRESADAAALPRVILEDGDVPEGANGAPVERINPAFTNGLGRPALAGALDRDGVEDFFIWYDGSILWLNSDHPEDGLDGAEGTLGVSDTAEFVYSPLVNGVDSLWSDQGLVLGAGMAAPGFPEGSTVESINRPTMTPAGRSFWVSEVRTPLREGMKRRETVSQVLYTAADAGSSAIEPVLQSGDEVDGAVIAFMNGLRLEYQASDDGEHVIQVANVVDPERGRAALPAVYVDGTLPMRRGDETANGTFHDFDLVAINDHGHYLASGETDADSSGDHFLAYDGEPVLWESNETLDAVLLPQAVVEGISIDNRGRAVHAWSTQGFGTEYLFFACDASRLADSTTLLASGTKFDFDGDGVSDVLVLKFNGGNGPTLSLAEQDEVYLEVELLYDDGTQVEAILEIALPACPSDTVAPGPDVDAGAG